MSITVRNVRPSGYDLYYGYTNALIIRAACASERDVALAALAKFDTDTSHVSDGRLATMHRAARRAIEAFRLQVKTS